MDKIKFQNKEYRIREIKLSEIGNVLISTNSLNKLLLNDDGSYVSDEARFVDESIYYFVEDYEIELSNEDLINLLISEVK